MADESKYKETKQSKCICCGKLVTVTKFMSDKKVKCDECKANNIEPNSEILASIKPPQKETTAKPVSSGNTKVLPCIKCGKDVEVTKFASAAKVLCDDCKGTTTHGERAVQCKNNEIKEIKVDMSKLDRSAIPTLEEYLTTPSLISNQALREVTCPACGHKHMKIISVMDWSIFGIIAEYQCPNCMLLVKISEQATHKISYHTQGSLYDYSGNKIEKLISSLEHTRLHTTIRTLIKLLTDNNITIDGVELPPYMFDNHRPVPVGFTVPQSDKNIKLIEELINVLDGERISSGEDDPNGTKYITISDTLAHILTDGLKQLFKGEEECSKDGNEECK